MADHPREAFELVIIDTPHQGEKGPLNVRLRRLAKSLLRSWGFRLVSIRQVTPEGGGPPDGEAAKGGAG
jgi:hypothetical protein